MHTSDLRHLLNKLLTDDELTILAFDYYRDVYDTFAAGQTRTQRLQMLIEHVERHNLVGSLLENPMIAHYVEQPQSERCRTLKQRLQQEDMRLQVLVDLAETYQGHIPYPLKVRIQDAHDRIHEIKDTLHTCGG